MVECGAESLVLAVEVGGDGGEGVEPAVEGGDLLVGVSERCPESGDDVVAWNVAGGWGRGLLNAGGEPAPEPPWLVLGTMRPLAPCSPAWARPRAPTAGSRGGPHVGAGPGGAPG